MVKKHVFLFCCLLLVTGCTNSKTNKGSQNKNSPQDKTSQSTNDTPSKNNDSNNKPKSKEIDLSQFHEALRAAILKAINNSTNFVTVDQLKKVKTLEVEPVNYDIDEKLYDFSIIKYMENLETLTIRTVRAEDFSFLTNLNKLKTLSIESYYSIISAESNIYDLSYLGKISSLEYLNLEIPVNNYEFLNPLSLKKFTATNLEDETSVDFSGLKNSNNLTSLVINNFDVTNYDFLDFPNLNTLDIKTNVNDIKDLGGLKTSTYLHHLNLNGIKVGSFSFLKNISNLESITLTSTGNRDLENLTNSPKLKSIEFDGIELGNLNLLKPLKNLELVNIMNTNTSHIEGIRNKFTITAVSLINNPIKNIDTIATLKNLQVVDIRGTEVTSIAPLRTLSNLRAVYGDKGKVTDYKLLPKKVYFGEKDLAVE